MTRRLAPAEVALATVAAAMTAGRSALTGSPTPALDTDLLLGHILGRDRAWLISHGDEQLSPAQSDAFFSLLTRRRCGEPVAYLRGWVEWLDLVLEVSRAVLIPRPETELLAEQAILLARERGAQLIVDAGTGSGAIAIAVARALPASRVMGVDNSRDALAVAARNVEASGLTDRVELAAGSLLAPVNERPDLIVANLPYLSTSMMNEIGRDVRHEPPEALHGGTSGIELYAALAREVARRGWDVPLLCEIDPRQRESMATMLGEILPAGEVSFLRDLAGHTRIATWLPAS